MSKVHGFRRETRRLIGVGVAVLLGGLTPGSSVRAQEASGESRLLERVQTISLQKGWNAVYLEVEPADSDPARIFGGHPIDIAATYFPTKGSTQFVTDPGVNLFKNLGWGVWYAGERPDAILTTLDAIHGRRAYLVHAKHDYQWSVRGAVGREEVLWQPDAFNFVGFPVASVGGPSFAEFFSGSDAQRHNRVYRLVNGAWRQVVNPAAEPMKSGEAFWSYCEGSSRYRGPLCVETQFRQGLVLVDGSADKLVLRNETGHPISASVTHVTPIEQSVPLSALVRVVGDPEDPVRYVSAKQPAGTWTHSLPTLEAGQAIALPFEARRKEMDHANHGSLLKITTDLGTECWVPVVAERSDLEDE